MTSFPQQRKKHFSHYCQYAYLTMIYALLYIPILVLIILSFNSAKYSMVWQHFSLRWYIALFKDTEIWRTVLHSILLGLTAAFGAITLGTLSAVALFRFRFRGKKLLQSLILILILMPDIVMGIALLILFTRSHIPLGFVSLALAHITFCLPFVIVTIYGRLSDLDKNIFEAAIDLGAHELSIFFRITLPLLLPSIIAAVLLAFTLSFDDVVISYFVSGPGFEILPLKIFSMARIGVKPELNALSAIIFCFTILMTLFAQSLLFLGKRRNKLQVI